jgi:hypothetical protein
MSAYAKIALIDAKIEKLQADRAELLLKADNEVNTEVVVAGDTVVATYGRADNARSVTGIVKAVKAEPGKAKLFKLEIGDGFDTELVTVFASAITAVNPQAEEAVDPLAQDSAE